MPLKPKTPPSSLGPVTFVAGLAVAYLLTRLARRYGIGLRFQVIPQADAAPRRRRPKRIE